MKAPERSCQKRHRGNKHYKSFIILTLNVLHDMIRLEQTSTTVQNIERLQKKEKDGTVVTRPL